MELRNVTTAFNFYGNVPMKFLNLRAPMIVCLLTVLNISTLFAQDAVTSNPDLFRILLENERMRVLDQRLQPGRKERMHSHPAYVKYTVSSYRGTVSYPNGSTTSMRRINAGQVMWFDGETHAQKNSGKTDMHAIFFELKGVQILQRNEANAADDALIAAGKTHRLRMQNDRVRVLEFRLKPKEETPLHHHRDGVVYVLNGGTMKETVGDTTSQEITLEDGDTKWMEAKSHKLKNTGTTEIRMLIVELKD